MKRKLISLATLSLIAVMTACSAASADTTATTATTEASAEKPEKGDRNHGTIAKVTAIDGSNVTYVTAEMDKGREKNNENGEAPAKPEGTGEGASVSEPPAKPEGTGEGTSMSEPPAKPEGTSEDTSMSEPPAKGNDNKSGEKPEMTFGTEEKTITVDSSKLYLEGTPDSEKTAAALTDIAVGTILNITYADDGTTVESITVRK